MQAIRPRSQSSLPASSVDCAQCAPPDKLRLKTFHIFDRPSHQEGGQILSQIMQCQDVRELADLCDCFLPFFDSTNVAFALYRFAKLQTGKNPDDLPHATFSSVLERAASDIKNDYFNPKCLANSS
eukprot:s3499_g3.t2